MQAIVEECLQRGANVNIVDEVPYIDCGVSIGSAAMSTRHDIVVGEQLNGAWRVVDETWT